MNPCAREVNAVDWTTSRNIGRVENGGWGDRASCLEKVSLGPRFHFVRITAVERTRFCRCAVVQKQYGEKKLEDKVSMVMIMQDLGVDVGMVVFGMEVER